MHTIVSIQGFFHQRRADISEIVYWTFPVRDIFLNCFRNTSCSWFFLLSLIIFVIFFPLLVHVYYSKLMFAYRHNFSFHFQLDIQNLKKWEDLPLWNYDCFLSDCYDNSIIECTSSICYKTNQIVNNQCMAIV